MNVFDQIIVQKDVIDCNPTFDTKRDDWHIAFGVDGNFIIGMGVCAASILVNNPNEHINFHIFTAAIDAADINRLKELTKYENAKVYLYYIDQKKFERFPISIGWTHAIYYRFVIGDALRGVADKVLYLDADILCIDSLKELMNVVFDDKSIVVVVKDLMDFFHLRLKELSMNSKLYFNSGMMYIDVNRWNQARISELAMREIASNAKKYKSFDQDVLNFLLDQSTQYVDIRWNYLYNMGTMEQKLPQETAMVHYTGDKPWYRWTEYHFMVNIYHEYMRGSPWSDTGLIEPAHYKQKRRMARSCRKKRDYLGAVKWYFRYLAARVKEKTGNN